MKAASQRPDPERKSFQLRQNKALSLSTDPPVRRRSFAMAAVGTGLAGPGLAFYAVRDAGYREGFQTENVYPGVHRAYQKQTPLGGPPTYVLHHHPPCSMRTEHAMAPNRVVETITMESTSVTAFLGRSQG